MLWVAFIICTSVIFISGAKLSKYGDIIAEKTGLGRTLIGVVLMASVTSLPELVTGISSVTYADVPDIAAGDILGSCVFNMFIIAILDAVYRSEPISTKAHYGHVLSGGVGVLLISIVCISLSVQRFPGMIGWIGQYSLLIIVSYFVAMRLVVNYEKRQIAIYMKGVAAELRYRDVPLKTATVHYAGNALLVISAALFLPKVGEGIAEASGLGQTFVGNILIALSTSLPEVVVSIAAVRMGSVDLAIGNLFGSNIFNILILAIDDIFFLKGPILSYVSQNHIISGLSAIAMTAIAVIGLTYRTEKKRLFLAWDSIAIVLAYIINLMLLYMVR